MQTSTFLAHKTFVINQPKSTLSLSTLPEQYSHESRPQLFLKGLSPQDMHRELSTLWKNHKILSCIVMSFTLMMWCGGLPQPSLGMAKNV